MQAGQQLAQIVAHLVGDGAAWRCLPRDETINAPSHVGAVARHRRFPSSRCERLRDPPIDSIEALPQANLSVEAGDLTCGRSRNTNDYGVGARLRTPDAARGTCGEELHGGRLDVKRGKDVRDQAGIVMWRFNTAPHSCSSSPAFSSPGSSGRYAFEEDFAF
jgi:hypothetical protein